MIIGKVKNCAETETSAKSIIFWYFLYNSIGICDFNIGKIYIIPSTAKNDSWKPTSSRNSLGLIKRITTADTPAPYSPVLLEKWIPNHEDVIEAVKEVMYI